jgi:hypothetical protein
LNVNDFVEIIELLEHDWLRRDKSEMFRLNRCAVEAKRLTTNWQRNNSKTVKQQLQQQRRIKQQQQQQQT